MTSYSNSQQQRSVSWSKEVEHQEYDNNNHNHQQYHDDNDYNYDYYDENAVDYDNTNNDGTVKQQQQQYETSNDENVLFIDDINNNNNNTTNNSSTSYKKFKKEDTFGNDNRMRCPNCGSVAIEQHEASGESVCTECGVVVEENMIVSSVDFVEGNGGSSSMVGQFVGATSTKAYSSNSIRGGSGGGGGGGSYNRHYNNPNRYGYSRESREQTLINAKRRIQDVASRLRLGVQTVDAAHRLYTIALERNFVMGRKSTHVTAACLYIACRQHKLQFMLIDFSDVLGINVYSLGATFLKFRRLLGLKLELIDPALYVYRFAAHLELEENATAVSVTALRLVARMKRDWIQTGRRPAGICAAALLIAARVHGYTNKTTADVTKILRVCGMTVTSRIREFEQTASSQLTLEQFNNDTTTDTVLGSFEHDPPIFIRNRIMEARAKAIQEGNIDLLQSGLLDDPYLQHSTIKSKWRNINKLRTKENANESLYKQLDTFISSRKTFDELLQESDPLVLVANNERSKRKKEEDDDDNDVLEPVFLKNVVNGNTNAEDNSCVKVDNDDEKDSINNKGSVEVIVVERKTEENEQISPQEVANDTNSPVALKQPTEDTVVITQQQTDKVVEGQSTEASSELVGKGNVKSVKQTKRKNRKSSVHVATDVAKDPKSDVVGEETTPPSETMESWKRAYPMSSCNRNKALVLPDDATPEEQMPSTVPNEARLSLQEWKLSIPDNSIDLEIDSLFRTEEEEKQKEAIFNKLNVEYILQQKQKLEALDDTIDDGTGRTTNNDLNNNIDGKSSTSGSRRSKYNKRKEPEGTTTEEQLMAAVSNRKVSRKINYDALSSIFDNDGTFSTDVVVTKAYDDDNNNNNNNNATNNTTKKIKTVVTSRMNQNVRKVNFENELFADNDDRHGTNIDGNDYTYDVETGDDTIFSL